MLVLTFLSFILLSTDFWLKSKYEKERMVRKSDIFYIHGYICFLAESLMKKIDTTPMSVQ